MKTLHWVQTKGWDPQQQLWLSTCTDVPPRHFGFKAVVIVSIICGQRSWELPPTTLMPF